MYKLHTKVHLLLNHICTLVSLPLLLIVFLKGFLYSKINSVSLALIYILICSHLMLTAIMLSRVFGGVISSKQPLICCNMGVDDK